jgi:hypothetical protein
LGFEGEVEFCGGYERVVSLVFDFVWEFGCGRSFVV